MSKYISTLLVITILTVASCTQGFDKTKLIGTWQYERTEFDKSVLGQDTMYQAAKHNLLKGVQFVFTEDDLTIGDPNASNSNPSKLKYTWSKDGDALIMQETGIEAPTLKIKQLDNQILKLQMGGNDVTVLKRVK